MVLMSIKDIYNVESIKSKETYDWLLHKHYAKRIPQIIYSFGLYKKKQLVGVCTYGLSASQSLEKSIVNIKCSVIELNRLCVNDNLEKNVTSYFVSKTLNMIKDYDLVVSFSDKNMKHNGYIYQATNFIYTGETSNIKQFITKDGNEFHFRNIAHEQKRLKNKINIKQRIIDSLSDDLLKPEYKKMKNKNKYTGHCYIASETFYHLSNNKPSVYHIKHEGSTHWFLKYENEVLDLTYKQFKTPVIYKNARKGFFLTKNPSKRSVKLINKVLKNPFKIIKRRLNEESLDRVKIAKYLRKHKGNYTASEIDKIFNYKDTAAHWFRLDKGFSFPSVDDWYKIKSILKFDEKFDDIMLDFDWFPCRNDIIYKLGLKEKEIKPKHRYIYILKNRKNIMKNLKYEIKPYPKGKNKRYDASYKPVTQNMLF